MTDDLDGAWVPLLDADTTREELDAIIDEQVKLALADARKQLDAVAGVSLRDKQRAWESTIAPHVECQTRSALTSGWQQLQLEAAQDRGGVVH